MKTQVEKLPNSRVALEIEVDTPRVEEALERAYRRVVRRIDIPGFRRGRAPRAIVERRIGREALLQEALDELLPEVFQEAVQEADIRPIDEPVFDVQEAEEGKPLRLKAEVDVRPEVQLAEYRGLEAEKVIRRVSDDDVERLLQAYQERHAQLVVPDRDKAEAGDFVTIDFDGFIDGQPFQGGAVRGQMVEIGSGMMIPGFEDQLVGQAIGETRDVRVVLPEENVPEQLRGKEAVFQVTLKEIKVKQVPPIDDELAKEVGEADTLEEWRQVLRERLERLAGEDARARLRDDLARQLVERSVVEIPESMVRQAILGLLEEFALDLAQQGIPFEEYLQRTGTTMDQLWEEARPRAERRIRTGLVLDALAKAENISVTDEEIQAERERMSSNAQPQPSEAGGTDPELDRAEAARIERALLTRKVLDLLEAEAKVEERWVDSLEEEPEP